MGVLVGMDEETATEIGTAVGSWLVFLGLVGGVLAFLALLELIPPGRMPRWAFRATGHRKGLVMLGAVISIFTLTGLYWFIWYCVIRRRIYRVDKVHQD